MEKLLEVENHIKYISTMQVRLERLLFKELRELNKQIVEKLNANFRKNCCQLDIRNYIAALIDEQLLNAAIWAFDIFAEILSNQMFSKLIFSASYYLECLYGRHKI